jgi:hypothetical protein
MSTTGAPLGNPQSACEALLTFGGDYQLTANNDLAVVRDTPYSAAATIQRITFMVMTMAALPNVTNTAVGEPDDMFNPGYGGNAPAYVGRKNQTQNLDALERSILAGIAADPFIAPTPQATCTFTVDPDPYVDTIYATPTFTTITGQVVTIPDIPITGANTV